MAQRNSSGRTLTNLRELGGHVADAAKRVLRTGAYTVAADAKSRVPVRTGRLRDSIQVKGNSNGTSYKISADAENNGYKYGKNVEYNPKINKPFLHPALDANRNQIRENIKNAARQAIRGR